MGLIRLVVILIIAWLAYSLTRRWLASLDQKRIQKQAQKKQDKSSRIETMVSCALCDLHVPQDEAVQAQGKYYCCAEHRKRAESS